MANLGNSHRVFKSLKEKFEAAAKQYKDKISFVVWKQEPGLVRPFCSYWPTPRPRLNTSEGSPPWAVAEPFKRRARLEMECRQIRGKIEATEEYKSLATQAGAALPAGVVAQPIFPFSSPPIVMNDLDDRWGMFVFETLRRAVAAQVVISERENQKIFDVVRPLPEDQQAERDKEFREAIGDDRRMPELATYACLRLDIFTASAAAIEYAGLDQEEVIETWALRERLNRPTLAKVAMETAAKTQEAMKEILTALGYEFAEGETYYSALHHFFASEFKWTREECIKHTAAYLYSLMERTLEQRRFADKEEYISLAVGEQMTGISQALITKAISAKKLKGHGHGKNSRKVHREDLLKWAQAGRAKKVERTESDESVEKKLQKAESDKSKRK